MEDVLKHGKHTEITLEGILKSNRKLGSRDRRFIATSVFEIIRHWRLFSEIAKKLPSANLSQWEKLTLIHCVINGSIYPNWAPEFDGLENETRQLKFEFINSPAILYSVPDWIHQKGVEQFGVDSWSSILIGLNQQPKIVIRINSLRADPDLVQKELQANNIQLIPLSSEFTKIHGAIHNAAELSSRIVFKSLKSFNQGCFEIQDAGSQLIAPFLAPKAGEYIIDACCGAGGKTLHLADLMNNQGKILAMDIHASKLKTLKARAFRANVGIIEYAVCAETRIAEETNRADGLLLDVPCSGSGTMKRQVDIKWKTSEDQIAKYCSLQERILNDYCLMVKPNGRLVYATCSIWGEENHLQIKRFLANHPEFVLDSEKQVLPSEGYDGFYMARLRRIS